MSKSSRKKPANPVPQRSLSKAGGIANPVVLSEPAVHANKPLVGAVPGTSSAGRAGGGELIEFDTRVKWTLGIFIGLFVLCVLVKWHFVSVPIWNTILPDGSPQTRGLVNGTPRQIRMDDYAVDVPWTLSNANNNFSLENEAIGPYKSALLTTPARHPVTLFKFHNWGYLFLDVERGFSFAYMSRPFVLLVCSFLFFLLLSRNQFWLSLAGAFTLLLSSGNVSWSYGQCFFIGYPCAAFVAFVYLLHARTWVAIGGLSLLFIWCAVSYALNLYPAFQVPTGYLFGLMLVGYLLHQRNAILPIRQVPVKIGFVAVSAALAGVVLYLFKEDTAETINAVTSTIYPGKRNETGGTGFIANWYSEYYSWFFSDRNFPKSWLNPCEMAHYLNFVPVVMPLSVGLMIFRKQVNWLLVLVSAYIVFMLVWMEIGFPEPIAKATLMSMVPTRRAQIPLGVGGIMLLFLYISQFQNGPKMSLPRWVTPVSLLWIVAFVVYTARVNLSDTDGLLRPYQLVVPVLFFVGLNSLLLFSVQWPYQKLIFCLGVVLFLLPNSRVNPLSAGLSPITDHALYKAVKQFVDQDPKARWLVNGNQFITYMVTATGAKQITGVKYIPDRKTIFKVLDPEAKRDSAYNRYAHVTYQSYINGRDSVILFNQYEDGYVIAMDPCSPRMRQLNVKYQVFDHKPQPVEVRCLKEAVTLGSLTIYQSTL